MCVLCPLPVTSKTLLLIQASEWWYPLAKKTLEKLHHLVLATADDFSEAGRVVLGGHLTKPVLNLS